MAPADLTCPTCQADMPVAGDEPAGTEVFCTYCHAPYRLTKDAGDEGCQLEEDF